MEDADYRLLLQPHDLAFRHRHRCRYAHRLAGQASFAAEFIRAHDRNDGFLPLLGKDCELDLAFLDEEYRIRRSALREDDVIYPIIGYRSAAIHGRKKD